MTSINTDGFQKTLLRLSSNSDAKKSNQIKEDKKETSFHSLLSNVENEQKKEVKIQTEEVVKSDISPDESIYARITAPPPNITSEILGDFPLEDVEIPIPNKIEESKIPEMPKLISSRRIAEESSVAWQIEDQESHKEIKDIIVTAGRFHGIDPSLGLAIAKAESSFNPKAVSRDGHSSKGVFQLLDSTAREIHLDSGIQEPYQPFNPEMNSFLGLGHLRRLHDIFSKETILTSSVSTYPANSAEDLEKIAVAAYNAGEGSVARAQIKAIKNGLDPGKFENIKAYIPESTRGYVKKVAELKNAYALNFQNNKTV